MFNLRSFTKSITSILLGIAIDKGYIKSIDEKVLDYLPQCYRQITDELKKNLSIQNLLTMKSGIPSIEGGANKFLFEPLGINEVSWEKDSKGINLGGGNLFMSPYDLAKIGYLYLNNGVWDNKMIVSKQWIEQSLKSYFEWNYGFHYVYLWYLKNEKNEKTGEEYIVYSASGAGGQKIYIIPDLDIVIVATSRTSLLKDTSYILNDVIGKFILPSVKF